MVLVEKIAIGARAEGEMITVETYERIRRAFYHEHKSMREIERELGHSYWTIRKALENSMPMPYTRQQTKPAPVLGPYQDRIDELVCESERLPRKQRYTGQRIYQIIRGEGYLGAVSTVRRYVGRRRREMKRPAIYLPLEFDPGQDAQVDWGDAWVEMAGVKREVQLFVMRLCSSRKTFAMAFPTQRQECFFAAHMAAFHYLEGVPHCIIYDNLKTAVNRILQGRNREEQVRFIGLRSHYLFESRFCTPAQGHEKGQVENGVGYVRRTFLAPPPQVASFAELNAYLLACCDQENERTVDRQSQTIGQAWQAEKPYLRPLPATAFPCAISREVSLNPYGQVTFETNRYSVPAEKAQKQLTLRAHPFHIEILANNAVIARHERCYDRNQDILEPLHYLPLLVERPGAFDHAKPLRQWRQQWPPVYESLLAALQAAHEDEHQGVRTFLRVLHLHQEHPAALVEQAIVQALADDVPHAEGVLFCLNRLLDPAPSLPALPLADLPELAEVGRQPLQPNQYNQLLQEVVA